MRSMKLRAALALLAVAALTAATAATSAAGPSGKVPSCPSGTTADDGLCVGKGATAQQSAELVRSMFESESLGAVVVGVWKDGKPLLVGALGDSLSGVPSGIQATVDMRHRAGNIGHMMIETVLLQQVEAGTLSLDDKLSKYLPDLPSADEITIDMVAHSTSATSSTRSFPRSRPRSTPTRSR